MTCQFGDWFEDCQTALEIAKTEEPNAKVILVGSSMGGWISLRMALDNKDVIKGLVLISPAINFLWSFYLVNPVIARTFYLLHLFLNIPITFDLPSL
jgi:alpha-beta hydrolase superfamily lysophospholipase